MTSELYDDWFTDNKHSLTKEFLEIYIEEFNQYCKQQFIDWKQNHEIY